MVAVRKWVDEPESPIPISQSSTVMAEPPNTEHGDLATKCGARKKNGEQCRSPKGFRTDHPGYGNCRFHGGMTYSHKTKAKRQMIEAAMVTYGIPIETTAEDALTAEINRAAGAVAWLQARVEALTPEQLVWGRTEAKTLMDARGVEDLDTEPTRALYEVVMRAGANVWLQLYQREREHLVKVCAIAIKSGLDERKVRLAERQGLQLAVVFREFVRLMAVEMGVPVTQLPDVAPLLRSALDKVMAGPAKVIEGSSVLDD